MAKTVFEDVDQKNIDQTAVVDILPRVKQLVRKIGPIPSEVIDPIQNVDAELSGWITDGWKLSFVERIATEADGHTVLYILTKD